VVTEAKMKKLVKRFAMMVARDVADNIAANGGNL